jgi:hypothetical protein
LEHNHALLNVVALFGVSSVIGISKRPPKVERLKQHGAKASSCEGFFSTDSINFVDTTGNEIDPRHTFRFDANGCKVVDFIFYPEHNKTNIMVQYSSSVLATMRPKLIELNLLQSQHQPQPYIGDQQQLCPAQSQPNHGQQTRLSDDELKMLLLSKNELFRLFCSRLSYCCHPEKNISQHRQYSPSYQSPKPFKQGINLGGVTMSVLST